jgi:hypothetical protein
MPHVTYNPWKNIFTLVPWTPFITFAPSKNIKRFKKISTFIFGVDSQNFLNVLVNDHQFNYITKYFHI